MKTSQFLKKRGSLLLSTLLFTTLIIPLSTVGFVSLQGYTKDAHGAMMRENIGLLSSAIMTKGAMEDSITNLISTWIIDKTVQVSAQKTIFWETDSSLVSTKAWDVQWTSLPSIDSTSMKDQYGNMPLIGYASSSQYSALQVATTIDNQVYIKGNYVPDGWENAAKWLIQNSSGTSELVDGDYGKHR